jgi:hypothetical protein
MAQEVKNATPSRTEKDSSEKFEPPLLFRYGGYLVYIVFLVALVQYARVIYQGFEDESWYLCIWALIGIFTLPKAVLGLVLIAGRNQSVALNIPFILWHVFPGTLSRYNTVASPDCLAGTLLTKAKRREILWLAFSLCPLVTLL